MTDPTHPARPGSGAEESPECTVVPARAEQWEDLEALFGRRGAHAGCWCMFWRVRGRTFSSNAGRGNRAMLRELVHTGERPPGLLAYDGERPVGWCTVEPRESYGRLERSQHLRRIDEREGVWSVPCFFVARDHRRRGVMRALLSAAVAHARRHGAQVLEGYPMLGADPRDPDAIHQGFLETFESCGFREARRRVPSRPIMRLDLRADQQVT